MESPHVDSLWKMVPIVLALVLVASCGIPFVNAYTSSQEVLGSTHNTNSDFQDAEILNNMKVSNGQVVLGDGTSTHVEDFEDANTDGWTIYNDPGGSLRLDSDAYRGDYAMEYFPDRQSFQSFALYEDFGSDGQDGRMVMDGYFKSRVFQTNNKPHPAFLMVNSKTGSFYRLDMVNADSQGNGFRLGESAGSTTNLNWLTGTQGTYYKDYYIRVKMIYNHDLNNLRAEIYKLGADSPFATLQDNDPPDYNPDSFAVAATGEGQTYTLFDELTMKSGDPEFGAYQSKDHEITNPTNASVDISTLQSGSATIEVLDGQGNVLGTKTVTSTGRHYVDVDPGKQADDTTKVRVEVNDDGDGVVDFAMDKEQAYFVNDPPVAAQLSPNDGETIYTNTPELTVSTTDQQLSEAQGDSLTIEWYIDGQKVAETPRQSTYTPAALSEGSHDWHVRVVDQYGGEVIHPTETFTVDHYAPQIDDSSASPSGGTETPYSQETLSIDVSDRDFSGDGDSLTVGWYVDGTLVHEDTGIQSNGTVEYTTSALADGQHSWYVKVGDSWGDTVTSNTFNYEIKHVAPTVDNPSIDGDTQYETNTLAVDVDDGDFQADGDTLTVGFYVDGAKVNEQTISSAQRVSYDAGPYADGNYNWHVEVADEYGYKTISPDYSLNIDHDKPGVTDPSIDGTTKYETNTLAVDVNDADFSFDGDTVDVGIYVDGALVHQETVSANSRVSTEVGPYADGSYTWSVEAVDDYGYKTTKEYNLDVQHDKPELSNLSPEGLTRYENNTLSVDVEDYDFQYDGDTVDVGFYVGGSLVNTQTISSNQTVTYDAGPYADGTHTWHVEATDDHGYKTVSPDQTIDIQHFDPVADNGSANLKNGQVTNYEQNTLSIDVSDGDFDFDGDTVDVGWYIDGQLVAIDEISKNQTVTHEHAPLADGEHTWYVELVGDYGDTSVSDTFTFNIDHASPEFDNSTMTPEGLIDTQKPTFKVDLSDADFPLDEDTVDVGLYVNESIDDAPELEGVQTVYQNGTVEIEPATPVTGNATYFFRAVDDYGYTQASAKVDLIAPNSLFIHTETAPHNRVRDTLTVSVVTGDNQTVDRSATSDGTVEFGQLPAGEDYVFNLRAENHYPRGVYVDDLYARSTIFLLNSTETAYSTKIDFEDRSGDFQENPIISIQTVINTSKVEPMKNEGPQWVTVGGDRLGVTGQYSTTLRDGGRYRFRISNQEGQVRTLGFYTAKEPAAIDLEIGTVEYPEYTDTAYTWNAYMNESANGGAVTFGYKDPTGNTSRVEVAVKDRETGEVLGQDVYRGQSLDEVVYTLPVNQSVYENRDLKVEWSADRGGEQLDGSKLVGPTPSVDGLPVSNVWLTVVFVGLVFIFAFSAGVWLGVPYVFMTLACFSVIGGILGIAPLPLGGGVGVLMFGLGGFMQRKKAQTVQPQ